MVLRLKRRGEQTWFEDLVGFPEEDPDQVRENLFLEGEHIISRANGKRYRCGTLEIPSLKELKLSNPLIEESDNKISVSEIVADVQELHQNAENQGAIFQAASQFNLLEMVNPRVTPERGITRYERDKTQGPACAIACGAGTIFRNYFVEIQNQIGQTKDLQIDCLDEIGKKLGNKELQLWRMENGYALLNNEGLAHITKHIDNLDLTSYESLKDQLKVGIQWNSEVTLNTKRHVVSQVYCSALPVAYSRIEIEYWEAFARLILKATYEATFYASLKNYRVSGNNKLYLTTVGGGAFGNKQEWIFEAIENSIRKFRKTPLDVFIVSYGQSKFSVKEFAEKMNDR